MAEITLPLVADINNTSTANATQPVQEATRPTQPPNHIESDVGQFIISYENSPQTMDYRYMYGGYFATDINNPYYGINIISNWDGTYVGTLTVSVGIYVWFENYEYRVTSVNSNHIILDRFNTGP